MAVLGAWQTGNWSSTSTWSTMIMSTMSLASGGAAMTATPVYSNTLTALNTTDSWRGTWLPFSNFATGNTLLVVLQEYNGATWSDTVANATLYPYSFNTGQRWGFAKFGVAYTPTTTTTGYYRLKFTRASGTGGSINIYGNTATTPSCMIASVSPGAVPTAGDDVLIAGDMTNASGNTNNVTVTIDSNVTVGSGQNLSTFSGASATSFNAINIDAGGRLKASRTASINLLVKQMILLSYTDAEFDFGKTTDRLPSAYSTNLIFDMTNNYSYSGVRHISQPNNIKPYYFGLVGAAKSYIKTNYASGLGTAASPLITADPVDWSVGDQIVVTGTAAYTTYANTAPTAATYTDATGYGRRFITLTFAADHSFKVGDRVVLAGYTPSTYNGTWTIDEVPTSKTLRIYGFNTAITANATVVGTILGQTSKSEYRYIITKNSPTSYVLATIMGGAEDALKYSPTTSADIYNLSSNIKVYPNKFNQSYTYTCDAGNGIITSPTHWVIDNCRLEYGGSRGAYCLGILVNGYTSGSTSATINNTVFYGFSAPIYDSTTTHSDWSLSNIVMAGYAPASGGTGITMGGYNKTITNLYSVDFGGNTLYVQGSSNIFRNIRIWSTNPISNSGAAIYMLGNAFGNTFINAYIQGCGMGATSRGVWLGNTLNNKFLDSQFGTVVANFNADIFTTSNSLNTCLFENCLFGSSTMISNYLNQLSNSEIAFHKYQQTTNKHRWYTNTGSARSTGAGLEDTTVKTAGSINLVLLPENNTTGFAWEFNVLAPASSLSFINGYLQKNAAFGSSVAKVELWLPGSDTSTTADASFTADNTTGSWQAFSTYKLYTGTAPGLSTIRITAISSTASAYVYVADLYNSVGALNLWNQGKPAKQVAITDFSSVPAAVWAFPDSDTVVSTMGKRQVDAVDNQKLPNLLIKDKLS